MPQVGFRVRIEARPDYAAEVEAALVNALDLARAEQGTVTWFAFKEGPTVFGIFDTFDDEEGRAAHFDGRIADVLKEIGPRMFAAAPEVHRTDLLAVKLP
ncbi:putative quinol monooxygenase [Streptacidiphilus carbonis]|uniref:putative quinol monooxygenase n=1 Tax=Streptacidiphilus carbonis TaxID=105422 RepID=UPI0005A67269|nr:antibiotic biosynthesis monooxygenase [Streptacidiphilus carbonis]